jgi:uncharacterized protein YdeI (BOF family)
VHRAGRAGCPWDWVCTLMRFRYWAVCFVLLAGCSGHHSTVLGVAPTNGPMTIAAVRSLHKAAPVTLHGTMVEKCPVAGCWFNLQDSTGVMRVDTKAAGFVVIDVPVGTPMTVQGKVSGAGASREIDATGLIY